jgi:hypothetical protein
MNAKKFVVPAECHSDDHVCECPFDAVSWLKKATTKKIVALSDCGWGGDYAADDVAMYMAGKNDNISFMFKYLEHKNKGKKEHIGFECHVQETEARAWLQKNRPLIFKKLPISE